jgi:hypothetical protein
MMAIMVHFKDDTVSFIPDMDLAELILTDSIVAFRRGAEWVSLGGANIQNHGAHLSNSGKGRRVGPEKGSLWKRVLVTESA